MISIKRIIKIFVILLLFNLILNASCSIALVKQSEEFFVNDTANILTQETKNFIIETNKELEAKTGAQIVVVTVKSLEGLSIEDYALNLAREYRNW